jgi:hypothetical protein
MESYRRLLWPESERLQFGDERGQLAIGIVWFVPAAIAPQAALMLVVAQQDRATAQ